MSQKTRFNYLNRDYTSIKKDLQTHLKVYYPDQYNDFNEASVGMMLLELVAQTGDILSYHVDDKFNELFLDSATDRNSVIRLAKNLGYRPRGKTGASTLLNVAIDVPTLGDHYDEDYLVTLGIGFQAQGGNGITYICDEPIDFSSHYSLSGTPNRTIEPNYNSSDEIVSYRITKTVLAHAGETKIATVEITNDRGVPYFNWTLDEDDNSIIDIRNIVSTSTRFAPTSESEWVAAGSNLVWYEMPSLAQERTFIDTSSVGDYSEGHWHYTAQRFISEYDQYGLLSVTFGAGVKDVDNFDDFITNGMAGLNPGDLLNNDSLGTIPEPGTYLHCRYLTGGGFNTNTGMNNITNVKLQEITNVPGGAALPTDKYTTAINSITVTNPIPAVGGRDFETVAEIKEYAKKNFSSQDRCVTVDDYSSRVQLMPSKYGNVFRSHASADPETMSTALYILTRDYEGKLKNTENDTVKFNLANYLSQYKLLNDFVNIYDGRIINLGIEFTLQIQASYNKKEVLVNAMNMLAKHFEISQWNMNETIFISQINEMLLEQPGVVNVVKLSFLNKIGGDYSSDVLAINSGRLDLRDAAQIAQNGFIYITPVNNSIKAPMTGMFEIKYPQKDIRGSAI